MIKYSKIVRDSLLAISILICLLVTAGYFIFHHSLPQYAGVDKVSGLSQDVRVVRDEHGVPHIFAATLEDAYRSLGYVHASERMFQMEMQRRAGQGRLSEVIGSDMVKVDRFTRTLGLYSLAQKSFLSLSPEAQRYFSAYAEGVNSWLLSHQHTYPEEFLLLGIQPEPWKPADSVVWGKLMALQLSRNYKIELLRASLSSKISDQMMAELFPTFPSPSPITVAPSRTSQILAPGAAPKMNSPQTTVKKKVRNRAPSQDKMPQLNWLTSPPNSEPLEILGQFLSLDHAASNEWVISGSKTKSGKPILANDPHLGLEAPVLWYLARLVTPTFWVKGATVPGLPVVLLGQNDHIAWGFTTTNSDTEDLFIETIDPSNPQNYLTPSGSSPFLKREEIIHVRGSNDITLQVRSTRHGPVLSDIDPEMAALAGPGKVMALSFTALHENDRSSEALLKMNRAKNWQDFLNAFTLYEAPTQNVVYADREGHIGFFNPGLVPVRKKGKGDLPVDGATGAYDWRGMVPFSYLPKVFDPKAGFIFNANNVVTTDGASPYFFSLDWDEPYRARRLQYFFDSIDEHTLDTSAMMQSDHVSTAAFELLPYLLRQKPQGKMEEAAYALMKAWNGSMDKDRPEPLIFEAWLSTLHENILNKRTALDLSEMGPYWVTALARILDTDDRRWCGPHGCEAAVTLAWQESLKNLSNQHGADLSNWRWGDEHVTMLKNKVFNQVPFLSSLSDLSVPSSGGYYTLDRGEGTDPDPKHPFRRNHGGGYRGLYDLNDPEASRFMIATGQSGHILSKHYGDLVAAWNDGKSFPLTGDFDELKNQGFPILTLQPGESTLPK